MKQICGKAARYLSDHYEELKARHGYSEDYLDMLILDLMEIEEKQFQAEAAEREAALDTFPQPKKSVFSKLWPFNKDHTPPHDLT